MNYTKAIFLTLSLFSIHISTAQCNDFNINFNYRDGFYQLSDPIKCKNGDYIISTWYVDSFGINDELIQDNSLPISEKSTLFRISASGKILQKINIQDRFPYLKFGPSLDSSENIYIPITNLPNNEFIINDSLTLASRAYSTYGIVKISKDFKTVRYFEIGKTKTNNYPANPHNLSIAIVDDQIHLLLETKEDLVLSNGSNIVHDSAFSSENHLFTLDLNCNISDRALLCKSPKAIWSIGWEHINNKLFAIIQYTDTIHFPGIHKTQIAALRANFNLPPKSYPGNDIAIMEIANGNIVKTYNIGCPGTFRFSGMNKKIHFDKNRYLFSFLNGSNGLFDDQNNPIAGINSNLNVVVVLDTNFNFVNYIPLETTVSNSISYLNLFKNHDGNTLLYTVSNNWFIFQNDTVLIEDRTDSKSFNVSIFKFEADSFNKIAQLNSPDFRFRAHEYTKQGLLAYLQKTDAAHENFIWGNNLKTGNFKNSTWFGRFCGDVLDVSEKTTSSRDIQVFPNPISDKIQLTFPQNNFESLHICIYDIHGSLIHSKRIESNGANSYSLVRPKSLRTNSMYFITISTNTGEYYKKTIITHD
jgi:hypothetical protein